MVLNKKLNLSAKLYFMKRILLTLVFFNVLFLSKAQEPGFLPRGFAPGEEMKMDAYLKSRPEAALKSGYKAPIFTPPTMPIRTAAQWEESQALVITWTSFPKIQREIVRAARLECQVIIHCADSNEVIADLNANGIPITNITFLEVPFDSIWIRDYAANTCYINDVDSLVLVDWLYNRPRPDDDEIPVAYSSELNIPLYRMMVAPNDIMGTGGNWMVDGLGTAFSSELILDENDGNGIYSLAYPNHNNSQIDALMSQYHGINRYIKMDVLPYDDIHHIDMHMKLLDEKTLLIGEFPVDVSDGPQIEANLAYVLANYNDPWGNPYKVVRVPMPPSSSGNYAGGPFGNGYYRTYANMVIVNKTVIMPVYRQEFDTTAVRIIEESMPGYNVVTIDADNADANLISQGGVIHCITHLVGVKEPLRIVHNNLSDTYNTSTAYQIDALIQHKSGIANVKVFWRTNSSQPYAEVAMTLTNTGSDTWTGYIPAQAAGTTVYYYIRAEATNGKVQVRPMTAPEGYWKFKVLGQLSVEENTMSLFAAALYPNPSKGITCVPFTSDRPLTGRMSVLNVLGQAVEVVHDGNFEAGKSNFFINTSNWSAGMYTVVVETNEGNAVQSLMVK